MSEQAGTLREALASRYRLDRDAHGGASLLGQAGMAGRLVAEATARRLSLKRRDAGIRGHFSDIGRAAASAASSRRSAETSSRS